MPSNKTVFRCQEIASRDDFGELLNRRGLTGEAAEIGTHLGIFAEKILERWSGRCLHLVDPWQSNMPDYHDDIAVMGDREPHYQAAMTRLEPFSGRFSVHRKTSAEAAREFADSSLDFAYVDGNHAYEYVRQDVESWWSKIRPGGILAGHDWTGEWRRNIRRAVLRFAVPRGLAVWLVSCPIGYRSWFIEKGRTN